MLTDAEVGPDLSAVTHEQVALELAVFLIAALPGIDSGPHVYALGQVSRSMCARDAWSDLAFVAFGIEKKLGSHVARATLEQARRAVSL